MQCRKNKVAEQTRLTSCSHRGSTAFLRAFPTGPNARIPNVEMRVCMQIYFGTIVPILAAAPARCHCWRHGATGPALADLRGHHDTVCRSNSMLARHNAPLEALSLALRLLGIGTSRTSVLMCTRRRDENGRCRQASASSALSMS